jgi:hypothetical protein
VATSGVNGNVTVTASGLLSERIIQHVLLFAYASRHEDVWRSGGIAPHMLNIEIT